ncbi:MAG: thioredoxin family protein [Clostridia bacterium]|nr:thioredoxin family protein [Deltaproteobacteria bacterium]
MPACSALIAALVAFVSAPAPALALALGLELDGANDVSKDVPKEAHEAGAQDKGAPRVHAYLLTDATAVTAGETLRVGVLFVLDEHYHIYWRNPGQAAIATDVRFSGSDVAFAPLAWPAPKVFRQADGFITTYGYSDEVLLFTNATVAADAEGAVKLKVVTDYLACNIDCTPGTATLQRTIPLRDVSTPAADAIVKLFDRYGARVPRTPAELGLTVSAAYDISAVKPGAHFKAALAVVACDGPPSDHQKCPAYQVPGSSIDEAFVPDRVPGLDLKAVAAREHPYAYSGLVIDVEGVSSADAYPGTARFSGVLELERDDGTPAFVQFDAPLERAAANAEVIAVTSPLLTTAKVEAAKLTAVKLDPTAASPGPADAVALSLWQALLLAFAGGVILNLMPCVLPVLAIKVSSFTQLAHRENGNESSVVKHAIAYSLGIVVAMLSLATVVLVLRAGGHAVGWGFQFQEPMFVAIVAAVLVVFAANLFGAFEITVGAGGLAQATQAAQGVFKSGLEGVLAVVVATPCSAPFLGTAVGFALAGNPWIVIASFTFIGLGLAAPFVVLTMTPGALRFVPRAGMWMVRFKQVMGFALLATVLWLAWVVGNTSGVDGMAGVLALGIAVGLGAFLYGAAREATPFAKLVTAVFALAVIALATRFTLRATEQRVVLLSSSDVWQPFAQETVTAELEHGNVVFVDFTADWCITCKVNERAVLASEKVTSATKKLHVTLLKADWTQRDDRIRDELARYGRAGVPMYLVYSPKRPDSPTVLPELLTTDLVIAALERAKR